MTDAMFEKRKMQNVINVSRIVTIHYFELDKNFVFKGEKHDFWEMVYIDKGEVTVTAENEKINLKSGNVIFHKPDEFHDIKANGVIAPNVFVITFDCKSAAMKYFRGRHSELFREARVIISNLLRESRQTFDIPHFDPESHSLNLSENPVFGGQQMIKNYLEQLLIEIIRWDMKTKLFVTGESFENHIAEKIVNYLEKSVYDNVSMNDVCRELNYGKTYLCHIFKEETGVSIMKFYTALKIKEAKRLIRERNYNITEISNMLMFNNPHYFSYSFKQITGMSPREYSNSVKYY